MRVALLIRVACLILLVGASGCAQRGSGSRTVQDFAFITSDTTLEAVIKRMGAYDRISGSGIQMFEYDLADDSKIVLWPDWPFEATNRIHRVAQVRGTNYTDLMTVRP
jgi:accessory colonization factor AcfC